MPLTCLRANEVSLIFEEDTVVIATEGLEKDLVSKEVALTISNSTEEKIIIENMQSSCSCLSLPDIENLSLESEEKKTILAQFRLREGQDSAQATILALFSNGVRLSATIRGFRTVPIAIERSNLVFVTDGLSGCATVTFYVDDENLKDVVEAIVLRIEGLEIKSVELVGTKVGGGRVEINYEVTLKELMVGEGESIPIVVVVEKEGLELLTVDGVATFRERWFLISDSVISQRIDGRLSSTFYLASSEGGTIPPIEEVYIGSESLDFSRVDHGNSFAMIQITVPDEVFASRLKVKGGIRLNEAEKDIEFELVDVETLRQHLR